MSEVKVKWRKNSHPDSYTLTLEHQMVGETATYNDVRVKHFTQADLHRLIEEFVKECV